METWQGPLHRPYTTQLIQHEVRPEAADTHGSGPASTTSDPPQTSTSHRAIRIPDVALYWYTACSKLGLGVSAAGSCRHGFPKGDLLLNLGCIEVLQYFYFNAEVRGHVGRVRVAPVPTKESAEGRWNACGVTVCGETGTVKPGNMMVTLAILVWRRWGKTTHHFGHLGWRGGRMTRHVCHPGPRFLKGEEGGWGRHFVNLGKGPRPRANTSFNTCATSTTCTTRPRIPLAQLASQDYQKIVKMPPPPPS